METQLRITLLLQIKFRFTRPTPELWLYNQCSSFNSGYCWPPEWGHAETLCKKAVSVLEHRAWNSYKRRGFGNCLKQRMVVSCHTGCVWDRATTIFKFLMDHASGTVHLFIEVTNICSLITDKYIQFAKRDHTKSFFLLLTSCLQGTIHWKKEKPYRTLGFWFVPSHTVIFEWNKLHETWMILS